MMKDEKTLEDKIDLLDIENLMYILFIVSSLLNIETNEKVKKVYSRGGNPGEEIRNEYIFASLLILVVFIVFLIRNYKNLTNISRESDQYSLAEIRLIGSILLVIGQCMIIYYLYYTDTYSGSPI